MTTALGRAPLALALVLALPAFWQTNESFHELERRFHAEGSEAALPFELDAPESLFLEIELAVRAEEEEPASVAFLVNGIEIADVPANELYLVRREKLLVSADAVRGGENELLVRTRGAEASFELTARLHNYFGINPKFPRAFVVSDEAAILHLSGFSAPGLALRFALFYGASLLIAWTSCRLFRRPTLVIVSGACLLWAALAYSVLTRLHVYLSLGALLVAFATPLLILGAVSWVWPRRLGLARAGAVSLVTLGVLEVAFRSYNRASPSFIFYSDSYERFRGRPFAPHFDSTLSSRGFLDLEVEPGRKPDTFRIVALGDSFALGVVPYDSNYLTLLEEELADRKVEVVNMGIAATGPDDYLAILVKEGLLFEPDLVLASFFIGNDFEARTRRPHEYSYVATFFRFLWTLAKSSREIEHPGGTSASYDDDRPTFDRNQFLSIEVDRAKIYRKDGFVEDAIPEALGALRKMRDIARRIGADFAVVLIPGEVQVDGTLQEEVVRAYRSSSDQFDFALPNRRLGARLRDEGIAHLDLLPVFQERSGGTRLYKPRDTHWNVAGNRLAAEAIARFLEERF